MSEGWIKLHRKMLDWEWWDEPNTCRLFLTMLLKANHKKTKWRGHDVESGQIFTGRKQLAEWSGLTERQVRTSIKHLEATSEVTSLKRPKFTIYTITSWDEYQETTSKVTSKRPASDQQVTTSKNDKNDKEYISGDLFDGDKPVSDQPEYPDAFEKVWKSLPVRIENNKRKVGDKKKASKIFSKLTQSFTVEEITNAAIEYAEGQKGKDPQFIKSKENWLSRFSREEIETVTPRKKYKGRTL